MYTSEKNTKQLTVRGGGVNPYGQPDRKISVFFFDDFPKYLSKKFSFCISSAKLHRLESEQYFPNPKFPFSFWVEISPVEM